MNRNTNKHVKLKRSRLTETADGHLLVRSPIAYLYLLVPVCMLVVFLLYPTVMTGRMAFYEKFVYITSKGSGFGLSSFEYVLSDPVFWTAARNTLILLLVALPITVLLSLSSALLINSIKKLQGFFQSIFFLPYVTSSIAIGSAFRWLFHSDYGYLTWFLNLLGIEAQAWLTDSSLVIWTLCIFCIWNGLAYKIVLFLAGLQKIDKDVYKAAKIDGASPVRTTMKITLPLLAPTTWMVSIMSMIFTAKAYNEVYALFTGYGGGGTAGIGNNAITIVYYIYYQFSQRSKVNYAAAAAILFLIFILLLTLIQRLMSKKFVQYI
jgi:multiple sugar transport system permease protein